MGKFNFVKETNIRHSREVVMEHINKLQPLNYNKFMWWRTHTDKVVPLGKRAMLKDRILNGDFNPSSFFWQAQLALYMAKDKLDLTKHDVRYQIEICAVDFARHKRLMEDFEKEETNRMEALYDAFTSAYQITKEELEEEFLRWPGDILSFYYKAENFFRTTPAENRKNMRGRGRPPKIKTETVPKVLQVKRGRGRPKKIV
jgi:isochorismate synthase EntC